MHHLVILAGGSGTRVWPASRRARPKQLLPLGARAGESLLAATVKRLIPLVPAERVWVVTAADQARAVRADVPEVPADHVIAEPAARNTAVAIGLATAHVLATDADAVIGVLPADHHIGDEAGFRTVAGRALAAAEKYGEIVTVGVRPSRPETGFGYLAIGEEIEPGVVTVERFVEKPDRATAEKYVGSGRYLWNGGMFFFRGERILRAIEYHLPPTGALLKQISAALASGGASAGQAVAVRQYSDAPSVSIDCGVMEKETGILSVPGDFEWNDVGSWAALADYRAADEAGNIAAADLIAHQARRNIVFAEAGTLVALLGVEDLVVVQAERAILVAPRERAQDVREIVRLLEMTHRDDYL